MKLRHAGFAAAVLASLALTITVPAYAGSTVVIDSNADPIPPGITPPPPGVGGGHMDIVINPGPGLAADPAALAAFQRGADQWANRIANPITITINADLTALGSSTVIGQAATTQYCDDFDSYRAKLLQHAAGTALAPLMNALPTQAQFTANLPPVPVPDVAQPALTNIYGTRAVFKALGYSQTFLDATDPGGVDGTISFNSAFPFDFDNRDGVTPGTVDFETIAAHEIGHVLGFISAAAATDDDLIIDGVYGLDFFRFNDAAPPKTLADIINAPREFRSGVGAVTSDLVHNFEMSTGYFHGDGRQSSHWKDDALTGRYIGIMDPSLAYGRIETVTEDDLEAMALLGYDVVPLPPALWAALPLMGIALVKVRRRVEAQNS